MMPTVDLYTLRNQLLQSEKYLGDPDLPNKVHWVTEGRRDILVLNDDQENDNQTVDHVQPVVLSTVVRIFDQLFWLTSDAGWKGPTDFTACLHQAKASCVGVRPNEDAGPFQSDFAVIADNTKTLQNLAATPQFEVKVGFASNTNSPAAQLKFRHVLFEELTTEDASEEQLEG
ncbi:hypothetical protein JVT61DRAFT_10778 [Boletus reticuloceps]|uniref:Uncharacterized protein n=1 Tax=Boletus reticuloceps TaxID=495285 RepID=A0A8I2YFK2_9AGAM|nr:hypothetical protein JVT61DRAFT_10778 [Boletus reticuloceps]